MMIIDLTNTAALITGGSGGIGSAIARTMASAGCSVAIGYKEHETGALKTQEECGSQAIVVQGDVSNPRECVQMAEIVHTRLGRIDFLVNNAGIEMEDSFSLPYEDWVSRWRATLDTNLLSAVHMTFCCVPFMKAQGGGKVINIASRSAFRAETEHMAYAVSKAGMVNFTRCVARALAKDKILAYAVAPGFIEAGMGLDGIERHGEEIRAQIPSGQIGSAQDVANVVLFLASHLSNYVTGSTIDVNGGSYLH